MSRTAIENKIYDVWHWLAERYGCDEAASMVYPLSWYINTDRASLEFLERFLTAKTFVLGRVLAKDGSVDDTVARLKCKILGE